MKNASVQDGGLFLLSLFCSFCRYTGQGIEDEALVILVSLSKSFTICHKYFLIPGEVLQNSSCRAKPLPGKIVYFMHKI